MAMQYGYDESCWDLGEQYLFGYDFLVAPCMTENATTVSVYIPQLSGPWVHLVSQGVRESGSQAQLDIPEDVVMLLLLSSSSSAVSYL